MCSNVAGVGQDECGVLVLSQRADLLVPDHRRVAVDIDDPRVRSQALGDLVHVVCRRQAGAVVDELPDAPFISEIANHPFQETPAIARHRLRAGEHALDLVRCHAVDGVVVSPAEQVVVHAGTADRFSVDTGEIVSCHSRSVLWGAPTAPRPAL